MTGQTGRPNILVLGRAGMDLYADPIGQTIVGAKGFAAMLGGSAANIAAGLARLGADVGLATCLSEDAVGHFVLAELDRFGIDRRHVRMVADGSRTSLAVVETRAENCQSVIYRNNAADFAWSPADAAEIDMETVSHLVITGTALAAEPSRSACFKAMDMARDAGRPVILDVDYRPYSWPTRDEASRIGQFIARSASIVVGNDEEFDMLAGATGGGLALAEALAGEQGRIIVYKRGHKGSISLSGSTRIARGIFAVDALKPTGAGDAFLASFIHALVGGQPLETAVERGSAAASIVVGRVGCSEAMPVSTEVDAVLATRTMTTPED